MARAPFGSASPTTEQMGSGRQAVVALVVVLAGLAGLQLFVLGDSTATTFAWTVSPTLAAAFLGAAFWGVAVAAISAYRSAEWRELSVLLPVATITTTLVLIATLLHLDKFHFGAAQLLPVIAAWVWVAVYVVVPPIFALLWRAELGRRGRAGWGLTSRLRGETGTRPYPPRLRSALAVMAGGLAIVAVILFVVPGTLPWPWTLTPLTSRMTAAFLAGVASTALVMAVEEDLARLRIAAVAMVGFGVFQILAVARFRSDVTAGPVVAWLWILFLVATIGLGGAVLVLGSSRRRR